jgi:hypothetical protein
MGSASFEGSVDRKQGNYSEWNVESGEWRVEMKGALRAILIRRD